MKKNLFIPLLVFLFVVLGCSKIKEMANAAKSPAGSNSNSGSSSNSGSAKSASTTGVDPKADIIAASKKFIELPAFSAKMEGTGVNQLRMQVDYAAPDRFHMTYLGGTAKGMEIIIIGKQTYMKTAGKWMKSPVGMGEAMPSLRDSFTEEGLKTLSDVKFDGDDTVDGKPALVYSYKNVTPKGNYPFTSKIWIGKDSGLPMKIEVNYENGSLKQMNVVYDTETPVSIEPPIG